MTIQSESWTTDSVHARVQEMFVALNDHDAVRFTSYLSDDVVWIDPTSAHPAIGRDAVARELTSFWRAFPDMQFPSEELHVYTAPDPTRAIASWQATGTMSGPLDPPGFAPTGKSVTMQGVCIYQFRAGECSRHTLLFDMFGFMHSLGLLPDPEGASVKTYAGAQRAVKALQERIRRR